MTDQAAASLAELREIVADLRELNRQEHPDITDRFGRVWVWHHEDLYIHDNAISCPGHLIESPNMQLPNRKLRGNPNYAGLCEICTSEW